MMTPKPHPAPASPSSDYRRTLNVLAGNPDGVTEALLLAQSFSPSILAELVRDGLATAVTERVGREWPVEVVCLRITAAGRKAARHMTDGARCEITVDSKPRTNRDVKAIAIEAEVTVRDRDSGETIIIKPQPPILK
jgi:hypothetical protein